MNARFRLLSVLVVVAWGSACHTSTSTPPTQKVHGQTEFVSAPPGGGNAGGKSANAGNGAPQSNAGGSTTSGATRTVEETDIYRLDGDRLYFLNGYRGLMVFDVSNVDAPKLLGRAPIYGTPVEMIVRNGIASVVVADWYGVAADGSPFHGSLVRTIDATDPTQMKVLGEAQLGGWVRDTRVVGDVLYAVSEDSGWSYGYPLAGAKSSGGGVASAGSGVAYPGATQEKIIVSSVNIANGAVAVGHQEFSGWGGVFNVTPAAIMLAHDEVTDPTQPDSMPTGNTVLQYIDISDPQGSIQLRGALTVRGRVQGWGTDNGRWNIDFADQLHAHAIACGESWCGASGNYVLSTADFSDPDLPKLTSELSIPSAGWSIAARFDGSRLYLSPSDTYYTPNSVMATPVQIYDLSDAAAPKLVGQTSVMGNVWNFVPSGNSLFALGSLTPDGSGSAVSLSDIDVTNPAMPKLIGTASFGDGWAWTPAAGTFKAFTKDDAQGLVVLPFSGWDSNSYTYSNGLQLIEFTSTSIQAVGAAHTKGWVERGIFVKNRLVSLSDLALSVVDYADHNHPMVVTELTLARNVVDGTPQGTTIAELSSDWWGNDLSSSELRILPLANAEEKTGDTVADLQIAGVNARSFHNGSLTYVVTDVRNKVTCPTNGGSTGGPLPPSGSGAPDCYAWTQQVQVVDLSNGMATLRGQISLPSFDGYSYYPGAWGGFYWWDWYNGADVVQVNGDALAFRRWQPSTNGNDPPTHALYVVDLKNPDAPALASTTITQDPTSWWGDIQAVGNTLYTTHYEWLTQPNGANQPQVKYYLDSIDLSDRAHPKVGSSVNVPGVLVGGSDSDPTILYFVDYWWNGTNVVNDLSAAKLDGGLAYLQGSLQLDGWVGNVFLQGTKAYLSAQHYDWAPQNTSGPSVQLHVIDLSDPTAPRDSASAAKDGWGWLLGIEGDRAIVTSGWGDAGVDLYKLSDAQPPVFDQFVRTNGWGASSLARQDNQLFLSTGYWGVQMITLQ